MLEKTILLIEDDSVYASFLSERLRTKGYNVQTASSIKEGAVLIDNFPESLIILDIYLPDGKGWKLIDKLSNSQAVLHIIINTAHLNNMINKKAKAMGISYVLDKSSSPSHVIKTVETAWRHYFEVN